MQSGQSPTVESELVDAEASAREKLIFGLRRIQGIDVNAYREETGYTVFELAEKDMNRLLVQKLLELEDQTLRLTRSGLLVSDSIWPLFL